MFRNRWLGLVVALAVLALTLVFGTVVATPSDAPSGGAASDPAYQVNLIDWYLQHGGSGYRDDASNDATPAISVRPDCNVALTDAQLEQNDAQLGASASTSAATTGWVYEYYALREKWYAYHFSTTSTGRVIDDSYEMASDPCAVQVQP